MKTLQNNFTTIEQSKRLLEFGVPAWTADGFRWDFSSAFGISEDKRYSTSISVICYEYQRNFNDKLPCWSVGRLIEIYHICVSRGFSFNVCFPNLMNEIMYKLGEANSNGWLDLKKLEE